MIKVITGIRRCGKSVILSQIEEEVRSEGKAVLSLNFELIEYSLEIPDAKALVSYVKARIPQDQKLYVFLDEVQLVDGWNIPNGTIPQDISPCGIIPVTSCRASVSESSALRQESVTVPAKPVMIYCMCNRRCLWFQSGRR